MNKTKTSLLSRLGPGLLYAGAAVGVSHLVQSTKAGAMFGFTMIVAILVIHVVKYPFFEFGSRYTAATGHNILHGYKKLGNWAVWVYIAMTLISMLIIQSAVTVVTAGLVINIFHLETLGGLEPHRIAALISFGLLVICAALLANGRYQLLDKFVKVIILVLSVTSILAVTMLIFDNPGYYKTADIPFSFKDTTHLIFLATFLGWMPAPMDIAVWTSIWAEADNESTGEVASLKNALIDFRIGYFGTAFLAICFLLLGALVMYGSGETFSPSGATFAGQLMDLYQKALGSWAYPLVAVAAVTTMFSTTLTCLDAYPRTLSVSSELLFPEHMNHKNWKRHYLFWLLVTVIGTMIILFFFLTSMQAMVKVATVLAFVAGPILAGLNTLTMFDKSVPDSARPGRTMLIWCWLSLATMVICSIAYLLL
ncbi:MAG: divalent metal cation transporter [Methylococcales bacterium]